MKKNVIRPSLLLLTTIFAVSSSISGGNIQAKLSETQDVDKMLIVDCMLPGKIRRLGGGVRYQTARRPIKTTGSDCEIRGGEYVAYDRANYATALKVWLPQAKAGDVKAQTYVGEMFEQGLGTQPDYKTALHWYRKAAENGSDRAMMNLGSLYEQGLGVAKDEFEALNWYRKAAGLGEDELKFASNFDALEAEAEGLRKTIAEKDTEIDQLKTSLSSSQAKINTQVTELNKSTFELEQMRYRVNNAQPSSFAEGEMDRLKLQIQEKETVLAAQQQEIQSMRIELDQQHTEFVYKLDNEKGASESFQAMLDLQQATMKGLENQVSDLTRELKQRQSELEKEDLIMNSLRAQLRVDQDDSEAIEEAEKLSIVISDQQTELEQKTYSISYLEKEIAMQNQRLKDQTVTFEQEKQQWQQGADITLLQQQSMKRRLEAGESLLAGTQQKLADSNLQIAQQTSDLQQQELEIDSLRRTYKRQSSAQTVALTNQLGASEIELARSQGDNDSLRREISAINRELERLRSQQTRLNDGGVIAMRSTKSSPTITVPITAVPNVKFGKYFALIIGNSKYTNLPDLKTPLKDVTTLARVLSDRYQFKTEVLIDADRASILQALNKYREKLTDKDNFLLYYAGHGELDSVNNRGHWLPVDAAPNDQTNWISNVQITDFINLMPAKHVMVIADSCYSGTLIHDLNIPKLFKQSIATRSGTSTNGVKNPDDRYYKVFSAKKSRIAMTSGGTKPVLDGGGGEHSIFAKQLIDTLNTNRGILDSGQLYEKVNFGLRETASSLNVDQSPELAEIKNSGHAGAPFFFVKG